MLEEQITKLNSSVIELTAAINRLWEEGEKKERANATKAEPKKETKQDPTPKADGTVTTADVEKVCLTLVRKNPEAKDKIKAIIKDHGGELVKDVPLDKLPALKAALEAI